ncbi:M13 family metallopeptidase, partial [Candidatus Microgenomates bacterium]|nr:M13 family metallopeptidase [Candidatus Microgenomates bacterium]
MTNFSKLVDPRIRPQDDLYQHVNGRWLRQTKIPDQEAKWGSFWALYHVNLRRLRRLIEELDTQPRLAASSLERKVLDFYRSGLDDAAVAKSGLKTYQVLAAEVDGCQDWPCLTRLIGRLHLMGIAVFWDWYVEPDDKQSTRHALRLCQGGWSLPDRDYYTLETPKLKNIRQRLQAHIPAMLNLASDVPDKEAGRIFELEHQLATAAMSAVELRDVMAKYNKFTFAQLRRRYPNIGWSDYFAGLGIALPNHLLIDQVRYFDFLNTYFMTLSLAQAKSYLRWQVLSVAASKMGRRLATQNFEFYGKTLRGIKKMRPRWQRLVLATDDCLGDALGKLYVDRYFPPAAARRMQALVEDVRAAFADRIERLDWMQPSTKQQALAKLAKTRIKLGYSRRPKNYRGLKISVTAYLGNYLAAKIYDNRRFLAKIGQAVDPEEWYMTPPTVNAYFYPQYNEIVFPAGILQPPYFGLRAD